MLKKIDRGLLFLKEQATIFRCPVCTKNLVVENYGLVCENNHQFDLSKKGTLYFLQHTIKTDYNKKMLTHRGAMIQSGMYRPLIDQLVIEMHQAGKTVDVGCGEGSFLRELSMGGLAGEKIGFDISKDGIYLASNQPIEAFWCVADLTNLPFSTGSIDTILNIFSPSHYKEFQRVLSEDGCVIKVIPEGDYLKELRAAFYPNNEQKQVYSNEKVLAKFAEEMDVTKEERIRFEFEIPEHRRLDLFEMSPLEWQVDPQIKANLQKDPLQKITIDVRMLVGRDKKRLH
ncbi:methyltransferase domain-containing protein [Enterococcus sp. LJL99]